MVCNNPLTSLGWVEYLQRSILVRHRCSGRIGHCKGRKAAIMAIGRKIAIIVYNMLTKKQAYHEESEEEYLNKVRQQKISHIQRTINKLNISKEDFIFS